MSNPSPRTPEAEAQASDSNAQQQAASLETQLESIDLNDPPSTTVSQAPRIIQRSARNILEELHKRRLEVTRLIFSAGSIPAGKGSHGEVVVATLTLDDGTSSELANQVAVKKAFIDDNIDEEKFLRTFANELHLLDTLDHPNVIKLVGFVEDMKRRIAWLIFPWEVNGNVREFLLSGKWELPERVSLIRDVAYGLEYLHGRRPPIRHGDLKSLNILVNSEHRAVITDFGSARVQTEARGFNTTSGSPRRQAAPTDPNVTPPDGCPEVTVSATNGELTLTGPSWSFRWAAPEILNEEEPCLASDIWALGWIAWEVVTDNYPFPEAKTNKSITINVVMGRLPQLYDDGQLSQIGRLCYLMVRCWKPKPEERLSATECRSALEFIPSTVPRTRGNGISQIRSAALLVEMGNMHRLQCRDKDALKFFEEASALARSAGNKQTMARALFLSVDSHRLLCNYDKAEEVCNQSLDIYTSIGDSLGRANALHRLGGIHRARSSYVKAGECFKEALAIFTGIGNSVGRANVLQALGETHQAQSNYAKAEEFFNQALAIFESTGASLGQAGVLRGLGEIHQARSNHAKAEEYIREALVIFTSIGYSLGQANASLRLGEIHQARFDHAKAEEYFKQALTIYTEIGDSLGRANTLARLGYVHRARSNYPDAEKLFNEALVVYTGLGNSRGRTNSLVGLGEVLLRQARYSESKSFLHEAAEISNQIHYEWGNNRSKRLLAELLEAEKSPNEPSL